MPTYKNMTTKEIARLWAAEKPLYLEVEENGRPRRLRLRGFRVQRGQFQVKVSRDGNAAKWEDAQRSQIVAAW